MALTSSPTAQTRAPASCAAGERCSQLYSPLCSDLLYGTTLAPACCFTSPALTQKAWWKCARSSQTVAATATQTSAISQYQPAPQWHQTAPGSGIYFSTTHSGLLWGFFPWDELQAEQKQQKLLSHPKKKLIFLEPLLVTVTAAASRSSAGERQPLPKSSACHHQITSCPAARMENAILCAPFLHNSSAAGGSLL